MRAIRLILEGLFTNLLAALVVYVFRGHIGLALTLVIGVAVLGMAGITVLERRLDRKRPETAFRSECADLSRQISEFLGDRRSVSHHTTGSVHQSEHQEKDAKKKRPNAEGAKEDCPRSLRGKHSPSHEGHGGTPFVPATEIGSPTGRNDRLRSESRQDPVGNPETTNYCGLGDHL